MYIYIYTFIYIYICKYIYIYICIYIYRKHQAIERRESLLNTTRPTTTGIKLKVGEGDDRFNQFMNRIGSAATNKHQSGTISLCIQNKPSFKGLSDDLERTDYKTSKSHRIPASRTANSSPSTPTSRKSSNGFESMKEHLSIEIALKATNSGGGGSNMIRSNPHNGQHLSPLPSHNEVYIHMFLYAYVFVHKFSYECIYSYVYLFLYMY
jgi:hypothetical protein